MEIYLIRHTAPKIDKGICYGQSDIDVQNSFEDEVETIKKNLPETIGSIAVYSSPLVRCKKLAQCFSKEITFDDRLMEVNFGDWELQPWDAINEDDLNTWMGDFVTIAPPNGESYIQLSERVNTAFDAIVNASGKDKIIVAHGGVIRAIVAKIKQIALKDSFNIKIPYSHVVKLVKDDKGIHIKEGLILSECN
ncbi:MAG: alpha-ribazole phosphatase [Flavobacteriaceae bacterium]|nr:alpha-ribazole phosphatase [Flavobacteriaceae bacterium]